MLLVLTAAIAAVSCKNLSTLPVTKAVRSNETLIPVPPGYREIFRSDFSGTTLTKDGSGSQWWHKMTGGEFGYNWAGCPELSGSPDRGPRVQTLVAATSDLDNYMKAAIIDERGPQGKILKFTNLLDDPNAPDLSRNQVLTQLDKKINKLFYEFKYKLPKATADSLKARNGKWWDITEFHNNTGPDGHIYRLSFYIQADGKHQLSTGKTGSGYYFRARLYDDTSRSTIWADDKPIEEIWGPDALDKAWDVWHTISVHVEAAGSGPEDGLIKAWVDGHSFCNRIGNPLGWPWSNLHIFKAYVSSNTMTSVPLDFFVDDIRIYRGND